MPETRKLSEQLQDMPRKEAEKKISEAKKVIADINARMRRQKLKFLKDDVLVFFFVSFLLGFILWAWKPSEWTFWRSAAMGAAYVLLFEELQLHRMFKSEK